MIRLGERCRSVQRNQGHSEVNTIYLCCNMLIEAKLWASLGQASVSWALRSPRGTEASQSSVPGYVGEVLHEAARRALVLPRELQRGRKRGRLQEPRPFRGQALVCQNMGVRQLAQSCK